jgi:hypothetical protein
MADKEEFVDIVQSVSLVIKLILLLIEGIKKLIDNWEDDGTDESQVKKRDLEEKLARYEQTYHTMVGIKDEHNIV